MDRKKKVRKRKERESEQSIKQARNQSLFFHASGFRRRFRTPAVLSF